jgi:hypothetical protein
MISALYESNLHDSARMIKKAFVSVHFIPQRSKQKVSNAV